MARSKVCLEPQGAGSLWGFFLPKFVAVANTEQSFAPCRTFRIPKCILSNVDPWFRGSSRRSKIRILAAQFCTPRSSSRERISRLPKPMELDRSSLCPARVSSATSAALRVKRTSDVKVSVQDHQIEWPGCDPKTIKETTKVAVC